MNLDDEAAEWDGISGIDPETGPFEEYWPIACDRILVRVEGQSGDETADEKFLPIAHELAVEYLSRFVSFIKLELGQYWVNLGRISEWKMWYFFWESKANWVNGEGESYVVSGLAEMGAAMNDAPESPTFYYRPRGLDKTHWHYLQHSLDQTSPPDLGKKQLAKRLILDAKMHLAEGEYRMAAVEAITALETELESFIKRRCKTQGISNNTLTDVVDKKLFIADHLRLLLPLVLEENELDEWLGKTLILQTSPRLEYVFRSEEIIKQCIELNNARNKAVHKGSEPHSGVVKKGIDAIEMLLEFIRAAEESET